MNKILSTAQIIFIEKQKKTIGDYPQKIKINYFSISNGYNPTDNWQKMEVIQVQQKKLNIMFLIFTVCDNQLNNYFAVAELFCTQSMNSNTL